MKKKKGAYKRPVIKGIVCLCIAFVLRVSAVFLTAKGETLKERVLIDHLNGSPNVGLLEVVYRYGTQLGDVLYLLTLAMTAAAIVCFALAVKKYYKEKTK